MISEFLFEIKNEFTLKDLQDLVNKLSTSTFESFSLGWDFDVPIFGWRETTDEELEILQRDQEKERELRNQNEEKEKKRIKEILIEDMWLEYDTTLKPKLSETVFAEERRQALALSMTAPSGDFVKDGQIVSWVDLNQSGELK
jgi:hypothetical protein